VIHDVSLNEKHDCDDIIINSVNVNNANDMQTHKLGDAMFDELLMSVTYCNDHDWGDNASFDVKIYLSLMMNMLLKVGLEEC
jgi:hypothetical protein